MMKKRFTEILLSIDGKGTSIGYVHVVPNMQDILQIYDMQIIVQLEF